MEDNAGIKTRGAVARTLLLLGNCEGLLRVGSTLDGVHRVLYTPSAQVFIDEEVVARP